MRTMTRFALAGAALALVAGSLTGCAALGVGCELGADTPEKAMQGLYDAARTAGTAHDLCRWTVNGFTPDDDQIASLKAIALAHPDDEVDFVAGAQMGSDIPVSVRTQEGDVLVDLVAESVDPGPLAQQDWSIEFGHYPGEDDAPTDGSTP